MQPVWNWKPQGLSVSLGGLTRPARGRDVVGGRHGTRREWVSRDVCTGTIRPTRRGLAAGDRNIAAHRRRLSAASTGAGEAGAVVYRRGANCHAPEAKTGTLIPLDEVGADPHRLRMWTPAAAASYNGYIQEPWRFSRFRSTGGYASVPLDGIWMRAPYLHNGSVPSLADLLEPVPQRPRLFWRGYDLFDSIRVGFVRRRRPAGRDAVRRRPRRQQQHRPYVGHGADSRREAGAGRVHEDAVSVATTGAPSRATASPSASAAAPFVISGAA